MKMPYGSGRILQDKKETLSKNENKHIRVKEKKKKKQRETDKDYETSETMAEFHPSGDIWRKPEGVGWCLNVFLLT